MLAIWIIPNLEPRHTYLKWINKFAKQKREKNASNLSMRDLMRKSIHAPCLSTTLDRHFSMADWRSNLICTSCGVKKVESSCYIQFGMVFTMAIMIKMSLLLVVQSSGINTWFFFSQGWGDLVWYCDNTKLSQGVWNVFKLKFKAVSDGSSYTMLYNAWHFQGHAPSTSIPAHWKSISTL